MSEVKTEGIILKVTSYQDHHRLIQLLTPDQGILSLLAKGVSKPRLQSLLSPLSQLEVVYRKKGSNLYFFKEGFMIENHHFLRTRWELLEAAGKMGEALLRTQFPESASPLLYRLLISCLKQLPHFHYPSTLVTLFYLKLLTHEGVVSWKEASLFPLSCSSSTWDELKSLAHARSFSAYYEEKELGDLATQLEKLIKILLI